jgi:hypothetical protein
MGLHCRETWNGNSNIGRDSWPSSTHHLLKTAKNNLRMRLKGAESMQSIKKTEILVSGILALSVLATLDGVALAQSIQGPSSSQSPYVVRSIPGFVTQSILTVGDSVNNKPDGTTPYRMVGIPDGLGAFDNGDGTFTVLMNHELPGTGIVRAHGAKGAFVSKWVIRKDNFTVLNGQDLIQNVKVWVLHPPNPENPEEPPSGSYEDATVAQKTFSRFCSADLPALSAFYDAGSGLGYNGRIYMNGEESGTEGRTFAHLMDGISYELPWLGKMAFENSVANPGTGDKTVVVSLDDTTPGQVYVYVGTKTNSGTEVDKAGLTNGALYGVKVTGHPSENATLVSHLVQFWRCVWQGRRATGSREFCGGGDRLQPPGRRCLGSEQSERLLLRYDC